MVERKTGLERRSDYELAPPADLFMLRLLKNNIELILSNYASNPLSKRPRALDVGCGNQPFRKNLEDLGYAYFGIDVEQNSNKTVDIVCAIDRPLPPKILEKSEFDFILCTEVMEHVVDWDISFNNFSKLLAPGGYLLITCPHFFQLHEEPYDFWRAMVHALKYFGDKVELEAVHQVNAGDAWDVLGTLLGNFKTIPVTRNIRDRVINKLFHLSSHFLIKLLLKGYIQNSVSVVNHKIYQANVAVFRKPGNA
jgi:SAM-dependent methyltransferase